MDRGGTEEEALIGGAVPGILEGVFEKISLGQLEAMKALPADTVKNILGNIAKSVATNAGEEFSTELANTIFDTIFMGELSTYALTVQGYMSQGKSEADAKKLANGDLFARLCESAASGALMGALFGGGASASSYYRSQLAARGEAKLRAQEMPTPRELEALNASEPEALGAMVMLNLDQFDGIADEKYADTTVDAKSGSEIKKAGDFTNLKGSSVNEILTRIPDEAVSRKLHPVEGGATEGVEYKWVHDGQTYRVRIHNADPSAPKGSNASQGWIVRVQRGRQYFDYTINDFQPAKFTNPNGDFFDETIMNNTHIPILDPND